MLYDELSENLTTNVLVSTTEMATTVLTRNVDAMNTTSFDSFLVQLVTALNYFYTPTLIITGIIGNLMSIVVFRKSKLRVQSTSQYLTALACSDTLFLLQLIPPWLNAVGLSGLFHEEGFCQVFVYVSYVCCCLSSWLVVAFTVERFVAVIYPLRRNTLCTVNRARFVIITLVIFAVIANIPVLRFAKPSGNDCNIDEEYLNSAGRFNTVDTAISFTVPLTLIIVLNSGIMFGVCRLERTRKMLMKDETNQRRLHSFSALSCPLSQQRVTRMLLLVSSVFVLLNLPAYAMRMIAYATKPARGIEPIGRWAAFQQIALMFFNTNFGINFILYCLSGQNFRKELCETLNAIRYGRTAAVRRATAYRAHRINSFTLSSAMEATNTAATPTIYRRRRSDPQPPRRGPSEPSAGAAPPRQIIVQARRVEQIRMAVFDSKTYQ